MPDGAATGQGRPRWRGLPLPAWAWVQDNERVGIYLMVGFLVAWLVTMLTITGVMVVQHGYGLGVGGGQHVPASIVKQIGVGDNLKKMMEATNKP